MCVARGVSMCVARVPVLPEHVCCSSMPLGPACVLPEHLLTLPANFTTRARVLPEYLSTCVTRGSGFRV